MAETITNFRRARIGTLKRTSGRFTASGTSFSINTGLTNVLFSAIQGLADSDNSNYVLYNTTDGSNTRMGSIYVTAATSTGLYNFFAVGT